MSATELVSNGSNSAIGSTHNSRPSSHDRNSTAKSRSPTPEETLFGLDDDPLVGNKKSDCPYCCKPYRKPRVLHCLHAMCEDCIIAQLEGHRFEVVTGRNSLDCELVPNNSPVVRPPPGVIKCSVCQQDSNVGNDIRFVNQLLLDYVRINELEVQSIDKSPRHCEACKSEDAAVAICQDCSSNLCANCVQAHNFMRCFDGHKVVSFIEIKKATESGLRLSIHKPVVCPTHNDQYRSLCVTCETLVCSQCKLMDHKTPDHHIVAVNDQIDVLIRQELSQLMNQAKEKTKSSESAYSNADELIMELNNKLETAKETVAEAFSEYQLLLEKRKESLLEELDKIRDEQENQLNTTFQRIENNVEKIMDSVDFTNRLIEKADVMELLDSRKMVKRQLTQLLHSVPSPNVAVDLAFLPELERFKQSLQQFCGEIRRGIRAIPSKELNPHDMKPEPLALPQPTLSRPTALIQPTPTLSEPCASDSGWATSVRQSLRQQQCSSPAYSFSGLEYGMSRMQTQPNLDQYRMVAQNLASMFPGQRIPAQSMTNQFPPKQMTPPNVWGNPQPPQSAPILNSAGQVWNRVGTSPKGWTSIDQNSRMQSTSSIALLNSYNPDMFSSSALGVQVAQRPQTCSYSQSVIGQRSPTDDTATMDSSDRISSNTPSDPGNISAAIGSKPLDRNAKPMNARLVFGALGAEQGKFNSPHGFCLGFDDEIIVADTNNHRIQILSKTGIFIGQFGNPGKNDGELFYPRKVAVIRSTRDPRYVVCDRGNERSRMQVFNRRGEFVKKIAIRYVDIVAGLAVDSDGRIIIVDSVSPTVFRINCETSDLEKWFDCGDYMKEPSDIRVFGNEYFVCDFKGNCVCVFADDGRLRRKIGSEQLTPFPNGIDVSNAGDVLIGNSHGNRFHVSVFKNSGAFMQDFECSSVKVSRCCCLRITTEGYVVTLAKNNHHLLVLDTLYVK